MPGVSLMPRDHLSFSSNPSSMQFPAPPLPNLGNIPRSSAIPSARPQYSARLPSTRSPSTRLESARSLSTRGKESAQSPPAIPEEGGNSQKVRDIIKTLIKSNFKTELWDTKLHYKKDCGLILKLNKDKCKNNNQIRIIAFVQGVENAIEPTPLDENFDIRNYYDPYDPDFKETVEKINLDSIDEVVDHFLRHIMTSKDEKLKETMQKFKFIFAKLSDNQTGGYHRNRHSKHKGKRIFTIKNKSKSKSKYSKSYSRKKYRNTGRTTHKNKLRSKKLKKSRTYRK